MASAGEILKQFQLLQGFSDEELDKLGTLTSERRLARGDYLFREGEPGEALYFLYDGTLIAEKVVDQATGSRKDLAILPAFSLVGEVALIDRGPRSASVRAEVGSQLLKLARDAFDRLLGDSPPLAYKLLRALYLGLSQRLRDTNDELVAVYEIGRLVARCQDGANLPTLVLERLLRRLDAGFACVAVLEPDAQRLVIQTAVGEDATKLERQPIPLDEGLVGVCVRERRPLLVERLLGEREPWEGPSMIITPVVARDSVRGALILAAARDGAPRQWRVSDLSMAAAIANLAAPALLGS